MGTYLVRGEGTGDGRSYKYIWLSVGEGAKILSKYTFWMIQLCFWYWKCWISCPKVHTFALYVKLKRRVTKLQMYKEFERLSKWRIQDRFEEQLVKYSKPLLLTDMINKKFDWLHILLTNEKIMHNKICKFWSLFATSV